MSSAFDIANQDLTVTDGDIAVINLESTRRRLWSRFWQDPERDGVAEAIIEHEQLKLQFCGETAALSRLETLADHLVATDATSARSMLIQAQVASMTHRFAEASRLLAGAELGGAPPEEVSRLRLNIDQAC